MTDRDLIGEVVQQIPRRTIARTIQLIVFIQRTSQGRHVESVSMVTGFNEISYLIEAVAN